MTGRLWKVVAPVLVAGMMTTGMAQAAGTWSAVGDDRMEAVLVARTLSFANGEAWGFFSDGRVLSGEVQGRWSQGDETVCLLWPGAEAACYRLEEKGIDLRFSPVQGGDPRVGRYIDL